MKRGRKQKGGIRCSAYSDDLGGEFLGKTRTAEEES